MFSSSSGTTLAEPALVARTDLAAVSTPMANTAEKGPSLSGSGDDSAPPNRVVRTARLASQWELSNLPCGAMRLISEAKAPVQRQRSFNL